MKLQPNFSYQKYESKPEDALEQFQYQLMQEHIQVANTTNSTIDDASFWDRERMTSFTWVDGLPIWTKTLATVSWTVGGTVNIIPLNIAALTNNLIVIIQAEGYISDGRSYTTSNTLFLPNVDTAVAANEISIVRTGTNIILTSGGTNYSAWSGYVTVYYVKPRS